MHALLAKDTADYYNSRSTLDKVIEKVLAKIDSLAHLGHYKAAIHLSYIREIVDGVITSSFIHTKI